MVPVWLPIPAKKTKSTEDSQKDDNYTKAFANLVELIDEDLKKGQAYKLTSLLEKFKEFLPNNVDTTVYRAQNLQQRLKKHYGKEIIIHTQRGQSQSSILLSSTVTLGDAINACAKLKETFRANQMNLGSSLQETGLSSKEKIIHEAIGILREEIASIPASKEYFSVEEMNTKTAEEFVPQLLKNAFFWLLSSEAFSTADPEFRPHYQVIRKALALAQCAIYNSRKQVITPLHLGLAAQLHHDHGKKDIIETLNAQGFTISYDELRRFITALGKDELNRIQNDVYVPNGLIDRQHGGLLIQEGADNIDINCETIDGKGTFHSMARVVFQDQIVQEDRPIVQTNKIKIGQDKSLAIDPDNALALSAIKYFPRPQLRSQPPRSPDAKEIINALATGSAWLEVTDLCWVIVRMVSRDKLPLSDNIEQTGPQCIPFWTGFNASLADRRDSCTIATYAPIIDAKPADLSTLYTTMTKCADMTRQLGQPNAVQTMDLQLYALAQQVKWTKAEEFQNHILRLGGFHCTVQFIAAIGKLWGDGGLRDLLVDSGVYASNTADQMLVGKQFHRSVRGITLC